MFEAPTSLKQAYVSAHDLAVYLGCSPRHVWRMREMDALPAPIKLGTLVRWRLDTVDQFLSEHPGHDPRKRTA